MTTGALIAFVVLLLAWSLVSGRLERLDVTGPIVFVAAGLFLCNGPWAVVDVAIDSHAVHGLAEVTLALLLFADAAGSIPTTSATPPACRHGCSPSACRSRSPSASGSLQRCSPTCRGNSRRCSAQYWHRPTPH